MKAKISPTSPKRQNKEENDAVDKFLEANTQFVQPTKPRSIFTILIIGLFGGFVAGVLGVLLLTSLALGQPDAPLWGWFGITFPAAQEQQEQEVVIREQQQKSDVSDLLSTIGPAVVALSSQSQNILDRDITGSGLIIASDGYVASVDGVSLEGTTSGIVGNNAVFSVEGTALEDPASPLTAFRLDAQSLSVTTFVSPENLRIGDALMVLRRTAQGTLQYRTTPLVTANALPHADGADFFLSTEMYTRRHQVEPLPAEYRGAPVFTFGGEAVGLVSDPEAGTIVPIELLTPVLPRLLQNHTFERTRAGIRYMDLSVMPAPAENDAARSGALLAGDADRGIIAVAAGSPAEEAELVSGDRITAVNGVPLASPEELTTALQRFDVGQSVELTVVSDGSTEKRTVVLGSL